MKSDNMIEEIKNDENWISGDTKKKKKKKKKRVSENEDSVGHKKQKIQNDKENNLSMDRENKVEIKEEIHQKVEEGEKKYVQNVVKKSCFDMQNYSGQVLKIVQWIFDQKIKVNRLNSKFRSKGKSL